MNESWENINITYNSISLRNNTVCEPYHTPNYFLIQRQLLYLRNEFNFYLYTITWGNLHFINRRYNIYFLCCNFFYNLETENKAKCLIK